LKTASFDAIIDGHGGEKFMRSTFALDDDLLSKARALTGLEENGPLMREALQALIQRESARRLAKLGGSDKAARVAPRRRPVDK
jgi:Arc/MetJ family transcription regulator